MTRLYYLQYAIEAVHNPEQGSERERKRLPAYFYRTASGREPVREWLKSLNQEDRRRVGIDIMTVEFGWPVGMPVCKPLGEELWEIRTELPQGRIARVLFCIHEGKMVLLHGFIKETEKIPKRELEIARKRKADVVRGQGG